MWDAVLTHLRRTYPGMCRRWFDDIEPLELSGGTLHLLVREPVQLKYLQQRCQEQFTEAVQAVMRLLIAVRFVGEADLRQPADDTAPGNPMRTAISGQSRALGQPDDDMLISPDHSFENFVVGPGNRLAHAGAIAVARKPARAYNPFFVHGGVGLGKTHLLQAICQDALRANSDLRLYYTSCHSFMTQFHEAVQAGQMRGFRHRFRHVDILLIDDIHDLSRRDRSQEEFFHTFNSLTQAGGQVVLSSDAAPNEIPDLEERLTSRFNCGLVAGIEKPGFETRVEILKAKAALRGASLPDDVASYVAAKVDTNIRELEGTITKMQGLTAINGTPIDLKLAKLALGEDGPSGQVRQLTIQHIVDIVTSYYAVRLSDLLSKRRHKSIALPRQVCMWLARRHTRFSLEEIGGYFGGRDHTTVMHAITAVNEKRRKDRDIDQDVLCVEQRLLEART
ncbi:MAG: chromosomal replication initiator protein DnaA [Planctomycetota bacterium]